VVGQQVVREYVYAMTAVSPLDGRFVSLIMPWLDAEVMSIFLAHAAQAFPDEYCLMLLDGAGWHRAKDLRLPSNVALIFLPPYSPELNPVELVWDYLRDNALGNTPFKSLDELVDALAAGLYHLHQHPNLVHSMTCFPWINTLSLSSN